MAAPALLLFEADVTEGLSPWIDELPPAVVSADDDEEFDDDEDDDDDDDDDVDDDLDDDLDDDEGDLGVDGLANGGAGSEPIDLTELTPLPGEPEGLVAPPVPGRLTEEVVGELEVALLLLPLRVRLEALVAAGSLVDTGADLLADHEKALGHLVLGHGDPLGATGHEELVDRHAALHDGRAAH